LSDADLSRANLRGAYMVGAIIKGAVFTDAYLEGAIWINDKPCRAGSIGRCVQ
jgi:uncharacterized protein YjbI with pentapeptide repeats